MPTISVVGPIARAVVMSTLSLTAIPLALLSAQTAPVAVARGAADTLTLRQARDLARRVSPELVAAREAMAAAAGRERQAGVFPNPTFSYQREQTSNEGQTNSQHIAAIDQPIDLGGLRSARAAAARLRRQVAEARLDVAEAQLDFDVARAYARAVAADRRVMLAQQATNAFARARTVSATRLVEGDVSGYADRRVRLEAARYAGLFAEASLARRTARLTLTSLLSSGGDSLAERELFLEEAPEMAVSSLTLDSLRSLAVRHRAELRAVTLEAAAAAAETRLAARERLPIPVVSVGFKNEDVIGGGDFNGFVAGVSLPLPLWDRRRGAIEAAGAEARRWDAEVEVVRRRVAREVGEAAAELRVVDEQLALLAPQLGAESAAALRAAQAAYSEGEISLVEWLDAVRAYQEAESAFASLRAESLIRRAALERAVGLTLPRETR